MKVNLVQVDENHYIVNVNGIKQLIAIIGFIIISCGVLTLKQPEQHRKSNLSSMPLLILAVFPSISSGDIILGIIVFKQKGVYYAKISCSHCPGTASGQLDDRKEGIIRCGCGQKYYVHTENPHKIILNRIKRN